MWLTALSIASFFLWVYLLALRGAFWRADQTLAAEFTKPPKSWPALVAVIPARDEAENIAGTVSSLLAQDYPVAFPIVVVDDGSTDGTAEIARTAAIAAPQRLHIVDGRDRPAEWAGKVWAMQQGLTYAQNKFEHIDYILFTDADITHAPDNLRQLVTKAETDRLDLTSVMVRLPTETPWERVLVPPFIFFFQKLYPFRWINDHQNRTAGAAGGCMLVRRTALVACDGLNKIRGDIIDDCALARQIKHGQHGAQGRLWLGLATQTISSRTYEGLAGVWDMIARTAYTQLNHSPWQLLGTIAGMCVIYLAPPALLLTSPLHSSVSASVVSLLTLILMLAAALPTYRLYRQPPWRAALLPFAAMLYTAMTVDSALRHWRGRGGNWKGRTYSGD